MKICEIIENQNEFVRIFLRKRPLFRPLVPFRLSVLPAPSVPPPQFLLFRLSVLPAPGFVQCTTIAITGFECDEAAAELVAGGAKTTNARQL